MKSRPSPDTLLPTSKQDAVTENHWQALAHFTDARIGLGRAGVSIPTGHSLAFQLAHAQAIDAVHAKLDTHSLLDDVKASINQTSHLSQTTGFNHLFGKSPLLLHSQAVDRTQYLQRPDLGRRLNDTSVALLEQYRHSSTQHYHLAVAIVDGLSSLAIAQNALPFLQALSELLVISTDSKKNWQTAPVCVVEQGRVAIGDEICEQLQADCVLVLIGERPGLSSPDSLGLYLTWGARVGYTDAYRNCISNIRPAGLHYQDAANKACYLLNEARTRGLSGVELKDRSTDQTINMDQKTDNLLIAPFQKTQEK
ncbi:ethanolamine ammonia-lyase subunit EutC [Marinomonas agarivorans]|nr:ethanolamine ammonia-lyase subunit EutC [Marinomonas agarivorans]